MNNSEIRNDLKVRTTQLGDTKNLNFSEKHLRARRSGSEGTVVQLAQKMSLGGIWYVSHHDEIEYAVYTNHELEPA